MSVAPPGGYGTTILIGLLGYGACAEDGEEQENSRGGERHQAAEKSCHLLLLHGNCCGLFFWAGRSSRLSCHAEWNAELFFNHTARRFAGAMTSLRRDDRQHDVRLTLAPKCSVIARVEHLRRTILRMIVEERTDPREIVERMRDRQRRSGVLEVATRHRHGDAVALRHDDAGRPDLDIEFDSFAGR